MTYNCSVHFNRSAFVNYALNAKALLKMAKQLNVIQLYFPFGTGTGKAD